MSKEAVESVIGKAVLDSEFRALLMADPEKALAGFTLTEAEKTGLKNLDSETLDLMGNTLDKRTSKAMMGRF